MVLIIAAAFIAVIGVAVGMASFKTLGRGRIFGFIVQSLVAIVFVVAGGGLLVLALGLEGVRALTREEVAARVSVKPTGAQRFEATVGFADGRVETYDIAGDEIYIDGHILKWKPIVNLLGLHTSYRLDRIGGRYRAVNQEVTARRTVYPLAPPSFVDLVAVRRRVPLAASPFVDAEYGSATFVPVTEPTDLEVRVSTSGLLIRPGAASSPR